MMSGSSRPSESTPTESHPPSPPPCGQICSYTWDKKSTGSEYPQLRKKVNCQNILGRMAWEKFKVYYPPLRDPPAELVSAYTQDGEVPFGRKLYLNDANSSGEYVFSKAEIEFLMAQDKSGQVISSYGSGGSLSRSFKDYKDLISGKECMVMGTQRPWVEVMLLNNGAKTITTLEYNDVKLGHPQLKTLHPIKVAKQFLNNKFDFFDFGVSFSSLEHSGLGRYGDPINPYGDLEAMAQAWCMVKPGGMFILGVPTTSDGSSYIEWNAQRVYGKARLQHLTANWELIEKRKTEDNHEIFVLRKMF